MTIRQALKFKNKLIKDITDKTKLLQEYNSVEVGNPRPYDPLVLVDQIGELTQQLIELKSKIHRANANVFEMIFEMSELKSNVKALKKMDCTEGKSSGERFRYDAESIKESVISVRRRNEMIDVIENRIEELQDKLDHHNATTEI